MEKAGISKGLEASPYAQWDPHAQKRSDQEIFLERQSSGKKHIYFTF